MFIKGADPNARDVLGQTPLHITVRFSYVDGWVPIAKGVETASLLLKSGADPNAKDDLGKTPLLYTIGNLLDDLTRQFVPMWFCSRF